MALAEQVELELTALSPDSGYYGAGPSTIAVGRAAPLRDSDDPVEMLCPVTQGASGSVRVDRSVCIPLPAGLEASRALAVPALAVSLWAWDELGLELGEAAVYTSGVSFEHVLGRTAQWRGALPVVRLAQQGEAGDPRFEGVSASDPQRAMEQLTGKVRAAPGFAAVELTGRGEVLDILLEVMPRWGRVLLAGPRSSSVTVDFYNNIHRKGAFVRAVRLDPMLVFDSRAKCSAQIQRALRILLTADLASSLDT